MCYKKVSVAETLIAGFRSCTYLFFLVCSRALEHDPDHDGSRKLLKQIRLFENLKSEGNASFSSKNWPEVSNIHKHCAVGDLPFAI